MSHTRNAPRRMFTGGVLVAAALTVPTVTAAVADEPSGAPPIDAGLACDAGEALPHPDDAFASQVWGMSSDGEYLVGLSYETRNDAEPPSRLDDAADEDLQLRVLLWHDGEIEEIEPPEGYETRPDRPQRGYEVFDVNADGVVVGVSVDDETWPRQHYPWVHRDGETTLLPGAETGWVAGINDAGDVFGARTDLDDRAAVLWTAESDYEEMIELDVASGVQNPMPRGIAEDGTMIGSTAVFDDYEAYVWDQDGAGKALPRHPDGDGHYGATGHDVGGQWAVGSETFVDESRVALRWDLDDQTAPPEALELDEAHGVAAVGWSVGVLDGNAALQADDEVVELANPVDDQLGGQARRISDDGETVAGWSVAESGTDEDRHRAVVWKCTTA